MKTINHSIHCPLTEEIKILEKLDNPHLIKLADREVKKLANQGFISPPDLQVTLNMRNIIAKVDKYSNVIDQVFTSLLISFLILFLSFFFNLLNRIHQVISFLLFLN
jgi:hypothetical protein